LVAVNDAGDEVQKIVHRVAGWVELGPEEARRLTAELAERLRRERGELEASVEASVARAKAAGPFRLPTRDEVAALDARLKALEARVDGLLASRRRRA
jgi:polyhydroxyalkanoate synthesis regulator phasin